MATLRYDALESERLLAVYLTPDVAAQRREFLQTLAPRRGESVLDLGCGPGLLAAAIAEAVGPTGAVCGVDISTALLDHARSHCAAWPQATFLCADATRLPLADGSCDAAVSTQVLEYIADVDAVLRELHRVLRPGGRAVIVDTDWDSLRWRTQTDAARMRRVLDAWDAHAPHAHLPRTLAQRLAAAGFEVDAPRPIVLHNAGFATETYSNRMIDLIADFVARQIGGAEAQAWASELRASAAAGGDYDFRLDRTLFVARRVEG